MWKNILVALSLLIFKAREPMKIICSQGKNFRWIAMGILFIVNGLYFLQGFNLQAIAFVLQSILSTFISVGAVLLIGKWLFKGKGEFWNLFSGMVSIDLVLIYLVPLVFLLPYASMISIVLMLFVFGYYVFLVFFAISYCHQISAAKTFGILVINFVIVLAIIFVLGMFLPEGNVAGQAIQYINYAG